MDIVDIALAEVSSVTGGDKYIRWFGGFGAGTAWCSIFVSWCAAQANISQSIIPKTASTTEGMTWFRKKTLFSAKGRYVPKRGDIIFFKTGMSHVGIVIDSDGSQVHTVEGNSSNKVAKRTYSLGHQNITGYGKPRYAADRGQDEKDSETQIKDNKNKDITKIQMVYSTGDKPEPRRDELNAVPLLTDKTFELLIQHEGQIQIPVISDGLTLQRELRGAPGQLEFSVLKCEGLNFQEGDSVSFKVGGESAFYGYIFIKKRNSDGVIHVTAYDQIRYLKNHDTFLYDNITAGEVLTLMARDYQLKLGTIESTDYKLPPTIEDDKSLLDMLESALNLTFSGTQKKFVLYDDFGKLTLKNIENMELPICIYSGNAKDFDYTSSIYNDVYNQIKLAYDNEETGIRELYVTSDSMNISQWGVLQKYEKINTKIGAEARLAGLLQIYNRKNRNLSIKGAMGDIRVRGGSLIFINLDLGDIIANCRMLVESVKHSFSENEHLMDITVRGWDFV